MNELPITQTCREEGTQRSISASEFLHQFPVEKLDEILRREPFETDDATYILNTEWLRAAI